MCHCLNAIYATVTYLRYMQGSLARVRKCTQTSYYTSYESSYAKKLHLYNSHRMHQKIVPATDFHPRYRNCASLSVMENVNLTTQNVHVYCFCHNIVFNLPSPVKIRKLTGIKRMKVPLALNGVIFGLLLSSVS